MIKKKKRLDSENDKTGLMLLSKNKKNRRIKWHVWTIINSTQIFLALLKYKNLQLNSTKISDKN